MADPNLINIARRFRREVDEAMQGAQNHIAIVPEARVYLDCGLSAKRLTLNVGELSRLIDLALENVQTASRR